MRIQVEGSKLSFFFTAVLTHDHQAIMKFINLADDSRQVPKLQRKTYADFKLTSGEWDNLDLLRNVLKVLETSHDLLHLLTV